MKRCIGMIGIDTMGHGIARNVLQHGPALAVREHPGNQPLEDLDPSAEPVLVPASLGNTRRSFVRA